MLRLHSNNHGQASGLLCVDGSMDMSRTGGEGWTKTKKMPIIRKIIYILKCMSDRCICRNINAPPKTQRQKRPCHQRPAAFAQSNVAAVACSVVPYGGCDCEPVREASGQLYYIGYCSKSIEATRRRGGSAVQLTVNPPNIVASCSRRWTAVCNLYHISSSLCKSHDMSVWPALLLRLLMFRTDPAYDMNALETLESSQG